MNLKQNIFILIFALAIFASSCSSDPEVAGREYMPDMAHSIAYEANVYTNYYQNTWEEASVTIGSGKTLLELSSPRKPISGTIARGYAGGSQPAGAADRGINVNPNGSVPYYYKDTEPERTRAMVEIVNNPYHITEAALVDGKNLYNIFCATCHGDKADGNGYLVRDDGGVYPAQPANLINEEFTAASNGRYYHALMHGKNVMGGYSDKVSYEERWNVIHYIRSLQAKETGTKYSHLRNTLNTGAVPGGVLKPVMAYVEEVHEADGHDDDHGTDAHDAEGDHSHDTDDEGHSEEGGGHGDY
jgi:mono/diheme cytochrome c family protein